MVKVHCLHSFLDCFLYLLNGNLIVARLSDLYSSFYPILSTESSFNCNTLLANYPWDVRCTGKIGHILRQKEINCALLGRAKRRSVNSQCICVPNILFLDFYTQSFKLRHCSTQKTIWISIWFWSVATVMHPSHAYPLTLAPFSILRANGGFSSKETCVLAAVNHRYHIWKCMRRAGFVSNGFQLSLACSLFIFRRI